MRLLLLVSLLLCILYAMTPEPSKDVAHPKKAVAPLKNSLRFTYPGSKPREIPENLT
jgi:hypothetical protein